MHPIHLSTYGFPGAISEVVARAAMYLPPLSGEQGAEFTRATLAMVTAIFWANFISDLPEEVQKEMKSVFEGEDEAAYDACFNKYCDIAKDEAAQQRANRVLADLAAKLPALLREEYSRFQAEIKA